jgi:hypothetical protein
MSLINGGLATLGSDGLAKLNLGLVQTAATAAAKIRGLASAGSIISDAQPSCRRRHQCRWHATRRRAADHR